MTTIKFDYCGSEKQLVFDDVIDAAEWYLNNGLVIIGIDAVGEEWQRFWDYVEDVKRPKYRSH